MTLYTKFSNQRDIIHNIRTSIVKKPDGALVVVKQPDTEAAKEHVLNMPLFAEKIREQCEKNDLNMCPASVCQIGDIVEMEFIEGEPLYNVLNECIKNNDIEQFNRLVEQYVDYVKKCYSIRPFKKTESFVKVFGDVELPEGLMASDYVDIDLLFTNIIVDKNGKWNIIDYEWTFDFDIPVDFILWRVADYFSRYQILGVDLFERFEILEESQRIFEKMEAHFQNTYLKKTSANFVSLYQKMGMDSIPLGKLMDDQNKRLLLKIAQVFVDYGDGFNEENSFWLKAEQEEDCYCLTIDRIPEKSKKLRIDPAQVDCAIEILKIEASLSDSGKIEIPYITNGIDIGANCYVFKDNDPIIYIDYDASKLKSIWIYYKAANLAAFEKFSVCLPKQIENFSNAKDPAILQKNSEIEQMNNVMLQKDNELAQKNGEIEIKTQEILAKNEELVNKNAEIEQKNNAIIQKDNEIASKNNEIFQKNNEIYMRDNSIAQLQKELSSIKGSRSWRFTRPLRSLGQWARKVKIIKWPIKFLLSLKRVGVKETLKKVNNKLRSKFCKNKKGFSKFDYEKYVKKLPKKQRQLSKKYQNAFRQIANLRKRDEIFEKCIEPQSGSVKFSVLVPLYNTDEQMLKEMIESVLIQSYGNFELCLADGSDEKHGYVEKICRKYAKNDARIAYKKLEKNLGISGNSNACLEMATGEYISLFDHDDFLHPLVLEKTYAEIQKGADFIYSDKGIFTDNINDIVIPNYKSDYAPDTLLSINYICNFTCFKKTLLGISGGGFNPEYDGAQDHDLILRLTDKAEKITHIRELLYFWRSHPGSTAQSTNEKPYAGINGCKAITNFLTKKGIKAEVSSVDFCQTMYRIKYELNENPLVSIVISNVADKDRLKKCVESVFNKSTYINFEIVICDSGLNILNIDEFEKCDKIRIVSYNGEYNWAVANNIGASKAKGDYLLFLNNNIEIIESQWIEELLMYAQRDDVGAVGAKLLYPNNTVQSAGIIIGLGGLAGSAFENKDRYDPVYTGLAGLAQNVSAVSGSCMMIRKRVWKEIGGFNEKYVTSYSDIDFCLRVRDADYLVVWTPFCLLYNYAVNSQDSKNDSDVVLFKSHWHKELDAGDPYYNPNFSLVKGKEYTIREDCVLA